MQLFEVFFCALYKAAKPDKSCGNF